MQDLEVIARQPHPMGTNPAHAAVRDTLVGEIRIEFSVSGTLQFLLVEEKTGVPSFPGLDTQPLPGTMSSPGEFLQGVPTDFTAIYRQVEILEFGVK